MLPSFLPLLIVLVVGSAAAGQGHDDQRTMEEFAGFFPASDEDGASPLRVDSESLQSQVNGVLPAFPVPSFAPAGCSVRSTGDRGRACCVCQWNVIR
jgi:hypothetical protein